jgi:hypothetical protein
MRCKKTAFKQYLSELTNKNRRRLACHTIAQVNENNKNL